MLLFMSLVLLVLSKTQVFIILHSHTDSGWIKTPEEYFRDSVESILDNMVSLLSSNPDLKFVWSEINFLSTYLAYNPSKKPVIQDLINSKRLEIVGGGWVQHDEALPSFDMMIRQMETGFRYLKEQLNITQVKTAWQLDPFGHSSCSTALFEKMGFDHLVFSRAETNLRDKLLNESNLEFIWKAEGFGAKNGVFTHALVGHYYPPYVIDKTPYNPDKCFSDFPVDDTVLNKCAVMMEDFVKNGIKHYKTDNLMLLVGWDFAFNNITEGIHYIELIQRINSTAQNYTMKFATPSEYFEAVQMSEKNFSVFRGDLLPYICPNKPFYNSWTGFYGTYPVIKKEVAEMQRLVRALELIEVALGEESYKSLNLALLMHHDAITGTCKYHVLIDYLYRLSEDKEIALRRLSEAYSTGLNQTVNTSASLSVPYKVLYLYNSLGWAFKDYLKLTSKMPYIKIFDVQGTYLNIQSIPWHGSYLFLFKYSLHPYTVKVLFLVEENSPSELSSKTSAIKTDSFISNELIKIEFEQGTISKIYHNDQEHILKTSYMKYDTSYSGHYLFIPHAEPVPVKNLVDFKIYTGEIAQIAVSVFGEGEEHLTQSVCLYESSKEFILTSNIKPSKNSDIFLRFTRKQNSQEPEWFYLFNTANIMKKKFMKDDNIRKGNSFFPVSGGLFIDYYSEFLFIVPSFSLSAGMVNQNDFELSINRFPIKNEELGIPEAMQAAFPAEHEWLIGFKDPDYSFIYRKFLEFRHKPVVLYQGTTDSLTDEIQKAKLFSEDWTKKTRFSFFKPESCTHISNLNTFNNKTLATFLNICDKPSRHPFKIIEEVGVGGMNKKGGEISWNVDREIGFSDYNNSGANVLEIKSVGVDGAISSFELVSCFVNTTEVMTGFVYAEELDFTDENENGNGLLVTVFIFNLAFIAVVSLCINFRKLKLR